MQRDAYYGEWLDHPSRSGFVASIDVMLGAAFAEEDFIFFLPKTTRRQLCAPRRAPKRNTKKG